MDAEFHLPGVEALRREDMWGIVHDDEFKTALVRGCAGSGKTTIAIYRLLRHAQQGNKVRLLTYQNMLVLYIKNLVVKKEKKLQLDECISTFHSWYRNYGDFDTARPLSVAEIRSELNRKGFGSNELSELLIDEGQDLPISVFEVLPDYFNRVLVSGDIAQNVHAYPPDHLDQIETTLKANYAPYKPYTLSQNFRNSYETYCFARQFIPKTNQEVWNPNIPERLKARNRYGEKPIVIKYTDPKARDDHMLNVVLKNANVGSVGILCPIGPVMHERYSGESVQGIYDKIRSWGLETTQYYSGCARPKTLKRYIVTTFKSAKGLEFDIVVVPRMNFFRDPKTDTSATIREEMYIATTRARKQLYIYRDQLYPQFDPIADFDPTTYDSL